MKQQMYARVWSESIYFAGWMCCKQDYICNGYNMSLNHKYDGKARGKTNVIQNKHELLCCLLAALLFSDEMEGLEGHKTYAKGS